MQEFYSTKQISLKLLEEIKEVLQNMDYGSIELFIQDSVVTQITKRQIKKTNPPVKKK